MSRPNKVLVALTVATAGMACASTANAVRPIPQTSDPTTVAVRAVGVANDPNVAPYPGRYEVASVKGSPVNEEPVVLDITGEAELTAQKDLIHDVLSKADDGGLSWDPDHKTVVVRLVGPVDGSSPAIEQVKADVLSAAKGLTDKGFTVEFRSVKYSRDELEQLATRLFDTMDVWAPGLKPAIGGGWDPEMNRVDVAVRLDTGQASAWIERLRALNDDRITFHTFTPVGDGRVAQFRPRPDRHDHQRGLHPRLYVEEVDD